MTKFEWVTRCQMQFAKRRNMLDISWETDAEICYVNNLHHFETDPEGAANEEMDSWTDD